MDRHLDWEGCYNVRDLGGLPTEDGRRTRYRQIIRADVLSRLTDRGKGQLLDYGVRSIIDLRRPQEVAAEPPASFVSDFVSPHYLNTPLERSDPQARALIGQAQNRSEVYNIILDYYPEAVAEIMRAIANALPAGVVIHCHAGKDRTGMIAALLLRLAGVPAETVAEDYAESQHHLKPLYEKLVAQAGGEDKVDYWLKPTATPEMMMAMLAHLDHVYGGVPEYLASIGLMEDELNTLRGKLLP